MSNTKWFKALELDELAEGRVVSKSLGTKPICLTHYDGVYGALDDKCPHQGGPLGEGSIENGHLRCPWHGWDFCPKTGNAPGFPDGVESFPVEVRDDGIYVELPVEAPTVTTISNLMMRTMNNWGVNWVFGMVGHSNLSVADAIRVEEEQDKLKFIGIRHEGAAAFAASAYGKLTAKPAACLGIAGPGSTNLLTGLWDANVDKSPVIALCGQVNTQVMGPGSFQELDLGAAFGNVAVYSQTVHTNSSHAELMSLACKHAIVQRGVSQVIFPDEVAGYEVEEESTPGNPIGRVADSAIQPSAESFNAAMKLLKNSKRPVIIVGHGGRFLMEPVIELAEKLKAPVMTTFKGKGVIPDDHPLACGVLGRSGTPVASWFMNESDCVIVFGASFSDHTGIIEKRPLIQVDTDRMIIGKSTSIDVPIWADLGVTAKMMSNHFDAEHQLVNQQPEVEKRWKIWCKEKAQRHQEEKGQGVSSVAVFSSLQKFVPEDAILCVDVGNNTYAFGRYFECKNQPILMSGYLGSIGFAFPAAIGAWAATQEKDLSKFYGKKVVSISGDGGFGQYMNELTTAVKYNMDITHILLNNNQLGKISKEQRSGGWQVWQTSLTNPDFAQYAKICGAEGFRVTESSQLDEAISNALKVKNGPSLVEITTDASLL